MSTAAARACHILLMTGCAAAAQEGAALLEQVDRLRHPWPAYAVEVTLGSGKNLQRWRVRARENGDARVEGLSEREQGRVVLLLEDRMWLLLPTAKRPVPVTPQQRLLGPASGGDLARTRFAEDYEVAAQAPDVREGKPCQRLELKARRPSVSWRTAHLWVAEDGRPLEGAFFLASGRLARTVVFEAPVTVAGARVVPGLRMQEPGGAETWMRFAQWAPGRQDPELFRLPGDP